MKKTIVVDSYEFMTYMNLVTDDSELSDLINEVKNYLGQTRENQVVITIETQ